MTVSGGRNDTIMNNNFVHNGSWGAVFVPFPDSDTPPAGVTCAGSGGTDFSSLGFGCVYDPQNDALLNNTFSQNGFFGNPTNGDYGQVTLTGGHPQNCYAGNVTAAGAPASGTPSNLEQTQATCWSDHHRCKYRRCAVERGAVCLGPARDRATRPAPRPTTTRGPGR